jgi:hypothetical protein
MLCLVSPIAIVRGYSREYTSLPSGIVQAGGYTFVNKTRHTTLLSGPFLPLLSVPSRQEYRGVWLLLTLGCYLFL